VKNAGLDHGGEVAWHFFIPVISVITEITGMIDLGQGENV
jgi:hypothetical protein